MGWREDGNAVKRAQEASLRVLRGQGQKFQGACNYCGIKGHKEAECRKKKEDVAAETPNKRGVQPSGGRTGGGGQDATGKMAIQIGSLEITSISRVEVRPC